MVNAYQFGEGDDRGDSGVFKDFFLNKISSLRVLTPEEMKDIDLDEHLDIMTRGKNTDQKQGSFCLQYYSDAEYFAQFRHWMHREFDPILQAKLIK